MSERQSFIVGLLSAAGMILIWSGFIVFGRMGLTNSLTPSDLTLLRYLVCGSVTLPFVWWWWPRHLPVWKAAAIALTGPGLPYTFFSFWGLSLAPASYGGVFANGTMPLFTLGIAVLFLNDRIGPRAIAGVALVLCGAALLGLFDAQQVGERTWMGALFLMGSAFCLSWYIILVRLWKITPKQALALVNVPNLVMIVPVWLLLGNTGIPDTPVTTVVLQALFHGLGPGFAALIMYAYMIQRLGSTATAAASAVVPVVATLYAIPLLGEWPTAIQWAGVGVVTFGLIILVFRRGSNARNRA